MTGIIGLVLVWVGGILIGISVGVAIAEDIKR